MTPSKIMLPSRGVNLEWVGDLELLEVNDPPKPLPGATVQRQWTPDDRLVIRDAKDTDLVCFYESVAAVRHKKTLMIYVVFRETIDALMGQQNDPKLYPKWLMDHSANGRSGGSFWRAMDNPKKLTAIYGPARDWRSCLESIRRRGDWSIRKCNRSRNSSDLISA